MKPEEEISETAREEIEFILKRDRIFRALRDDLIHNSRYNRFFSHYSHESVAEFINEYAMRKAEYMICGTSACVEEEFSQFFFRNMAEKWFWEIQQKKLFDYQCLWRAGKMKIPEADVTKEFFLMEFEIPKLTFLKPVSRQELNIYMDYLNSEDYSPDDHDTRWQDYDAICSGWNHSFASTVPGWYSFYDKAIGSGELYALPDMKSESESKYLNLSDAASELPCRNSETEGDKNELKPDYKSIEFFVHTFEDKSVAKYFYAVEKDHPDINRNRELQEAIFILNLCDEPVRIKKSSDWKHGIIQAAECIKKKKISDALHEVFSDYLLRINSKIPFAFKADDMLLDLLRQKINQYKIRILEGRRKLNEPADFNY